jgi:uncharacterized membrane protein
VDFTEFVEVVGKTIDGAGVAVIAVGVAYFTIRSFSQRVPARRDRYRIYRQRIGRVVLLGLELLVAGDIIRTVAVSPTFRSAAVLALIVGIRTFLSFTFEVELEGRWPWQRPPVEVAERDTLKLVSKGKAEPAD